MSSFFFSKPDPKPQNAVICAIASLKLNPQIDEHAEVRMWLRYSYHHSKTDDFSRLELGFCFCFNLDPFGLFGPLQDWEG